MTYGIIREDKDSKVLIVTPLYTGHKISSETKSTIKRNDTPLTWITSEGPYNIPTNAWNGVEWYLDKMGELPQYYLMIDRDIILGRHMIDRLYDKLSSSDPEAVYSYGSFEFTGYINRKFPAEQWDINRLMLENYISSNSMFRMKTLYEIGLVFDEKYKRLLDWAFLLKIFLHNGGYGVPCPEATFVAVSSAESVSSGNNYDYQTKRERVIHDFAKPIIYKHSGKLANKEDQATEKTFQLDF